MEQEDFTRKLAAIFYADVASYSRLTGEDEEGTHRRLSQYLDFIADSIRQNHGQVVHYAGDAVLADFITVSSALTCAIKVQQELKNRNEDLEEERRVQFRIGLHLGEVIVDRDDIFGEGVNVAARLEGLADPGGICISESARTAVGHKLPLVYEFMGVKSVKNISDPLRVYRVLPEGSPLTVEPALTTDKPTIAVLPFENLSGDPQQEYLVDGITEEIITALSRVRWIFVIARNSTFAYKGRPVDVRQVAKELGVKYILEGSVRKAGSRVRVNAQLIDGKEGRQVWANRFDREYQDIFALQEDLAETIVGALDPEIGKAERDRARAKRTENLHAWDLYQRGLWHLYKCSKDDLKEARRLFRLAMNRDSSLSIAYSALAEAYYFSLVYGFSESPESDRETALASAQKAVDLDYEDPAAHCSLGRIHYLRKEHDLAIPELEIALELNPSLAWGHYGIGAALVFSGQAEEAISYLENAIRLSPQDPNMGSFLVRMADAHFFVGEYEKAIGWAKKALRQPNFQWSRYAVLLAAFGQTGRQEEAKRVLERLLAQRPDFSVEFVRSTHLIADKAYLQHYLEGLQKAGVN
ncbi:MAG: tetratricopeptide repeat protein [Chloroflexota bacterium]|jgi:adenylate cyclase